MKLIISLNGMDGAGKTTQSKKLLENNTGLINMFEGLDKYKPFSEINDDDWWFEKSSADEFCDIIYESLKNRNLDIEKSKKPLIIVDKGLCNFEARILATLISKGLNTEQSLLLMEKYKKKHNVESIEDMNIFLKFDGNFTEQLNEMDSRGKNENFSSEKVFKYKKYQKIQNEILNYQFEKGYYDVINASQKIDEVYNDIKEVILNKGISLLPNIDTNRKIIGIGGLSESGKSSTGKILLSKCNIPNFKFKYLVRNLNEKYEIKENELFENSKEFVALLMSEEINKLLKDMYYWDAVSFESLHDNELTSFMKKILPNYLTIYLETNYENRVNRNASELNISYIESKDKVDNKDNKKLSEGASEIKENADYVICNDGTIESLEKSVYNIVSDIRRKKEMRSRAGGLVIKDGKLLLMHRIKIKDGIKNEYYVVPGGGIENGESLSDTTIRELKEEMGIDVDVIQEDPVYVYQTEKENQYFLLAEYINGDIGTGKGPEFTDANYANRGVYSAELVPIADIISGKINMVPETVKEQFINDIKALNIDNLETIQTNDLVKKENIKKRI